MGGGVGVDSWHFEKMTGGSRDGHLATSSFWGVPEQRGTIVIRSRFCQIKGRMSRKRLGVKRVSPLKTLLVREPVSTGSAPRERIAEGSSRNCLQGVLPAERGMESCSDLLGPKKSCKVLVLLCKRHGSLECPRVGILARRNRRHCPC